jgi:hypothetical protein
MIRTVRQRAKSAQLVPVWMAALVAAQCLTTDGKKRRVVPWDCVSGRAVYTNDGAAAEFIEPLGINLERGETLAVSWLPGETAYTMEVYGQSQMCA